MIKFSCAVVEIFGYFSRRHGFSEILRSTNIWFLFYRSAAWNFKIEPLYRIFLQDKICFKKTDVDISKFRWGDYIIQR